MSTLWYLVYAYALGVSFAVSLALTWGVRHFALRMEILDHPGERKVHQSPMPLLGGVAVCITFYLVILAHLLLLHVFGDLSPEWVQQHVLSFLGERVKMKLAGIFAGSLIIFALGVVDDLRALKPEAKLAGQVLAALVLVVSGVRLSLFIENPWVTGFLTVFWVVMMTNSLNFLDNMDGLCGGVSVIAALSMFLGLQANTFVCALLAVFAGSMAGFLYHNLNPARIFLGDAGSMFSGFVLATVAVLGTFYQPDTGLPFGVAAPVLALSVPLFDTLSVVFIRWSSGESIMKGDKRHFSHRLVDLGMTPRQAVEFIYLVAIVTGLGAVLLPRVGYLGTVVVVCQTTGVFLLIVLLMRAGKDKDERRGPV